MAHSAFTVALIGPDGAGKTTVARRLEQTGLEVPVKYLYMGINADASNHLLPTTRLVRALKRARGVPPDAGGPPDPLAPPARSGILRKAKAGARLVNQLAEECYRLALARRHLRRGGIVVFDRDFFSDYYAYDIAAGGRRPLSRRIHGLALSRLYRRPDLVIYLDAPPELLLARKGEGTLAALARRREDYLALRPLTPNFAVVDASRTIDEVTLDVVRLIRRFAATGNGRV